MHYFGICVGNALEENSEPLPFFNDCVENLQSFTDNEQNKDNVRDNKRLVKHHVHIKPGLGRPFVISVEQIRCKCVSLIFFPMYG